jgi:hypothetical protein
VLAWVDARTMSIAIDVAALATPNPATLGIKTGTYEEIIAKHSTISTASPVVQSPNDPNHPIVQDTCINGKTMGRLTCTAQYSAQGAADPPDFSGGKIYGNHYVSFDAGDTIVGYMKMERLANILNVEGTIDYDMSLLSNGTFVRTKGS